MMEQLFPDHRSGAIFDETRRYRYLLWRVWSVVSSDYILWIMLNPSTADEVVLDPTVRRCIRYSQRWKSPGLKVCNIFALKSTDPKALYREDDPVGPENDRYILETAAGAARVIAAWGAHGIHQGRGRAVLDLLRSRGIKVECLGLTKVGMPRHPLYLKGNLDPMPLG